jgi:nitrate reductase / nitrite oxidoreductase, alpha subunit
MTKASFLSSLRFFRPHQAKTLPPSERYAQGWAESRCQSRQWEEMYHRRWEHDKVARSTHGVNCTGGCSWKVYVKDGIIVWETQALDYPPSGPDTPRYEPRGCSRGASFSWYIYSPLRVKYPYMRGALLELWQEALLAHPDPVTAWNSIMADPVKTRKYREGRGKGGLVRVSWDQAATLIAAALVYTIKKYGPDRIFGFTPIPAMSMVCYASGARFLSLIGGSVLSFYDWYADWPGASPQVWGEKTDVPESADWFNSTYVICAGNNVNQTRTPDAHFYSELRYRGGKVVAVSPDYAEYVKFADTWLPARPGTDGALAMAMTQVIVKEFYLDRQTPYFLDYARKFTDLPFTVILKKDGDHFVSDRFLRATDLGREIPQGDWKTVFFDVRTKSFVVPPGSIGFRWSGESLWNLRLQDTATGAEVEPTLSFAEASDNEGWVAVKFPRFDVNGSGQAIGLVPVKKIRRGHEEILVATVFDLFVAHLGLDRGHGGARDYDEPIPFSPAWQEAITGVSRSEVIKVAREFAENAEKTRGKSLILLGSGTNHWFNSDMLYRAYLNLTTLCGCQGVNGGGWAHYTGQEKVRLESGWGTLAFALDWLRPPRHQNGTSFFYFATDQWRYEKLSPTALATPWCADKVPKHPADCNIVAARLGWLPFYPQFDKSPLELCREARSHSAMRDEDITAYVVNLLKVRALKFAAEDPGNPMNFPRVMFFWRANVLGASNRGHEYFLRHLLGAEDAVLGEENQALRPKEMEVRSADPQGKLDLLVTLELRMNTSAIYSDIVLPAATWYEFHDLNTTDLHPFIHPFTPAVDPLFESRTNWDQFKTIALKFSELAATHLGVQEDLVATPLNHDTPFELAQPLGRVRDWKKGETEPIPGKTIPRLKVVKRDFPNTYKMMTALGPLVTGAEGVEGKGIPWDAAEEYGDLKKLLGVVKEPGVSQGMPQIFTQKDGAEVILALSPESNGRVAVKGWRHLGKVTGLDLAQLAQGLEGVRYSFDDVEAQPRRELMSPIWTGVHSDQRPYTAFSLNIEHLVPFRTLTGRAQFYQDHEWMLAYGEALPLFRPPVDYRGLGYTTTRVPGQPGQELVLNYLTPHAKWSIHSTYHDNLIMMTLFRGGAVLWLNNEDAESVGIADNDWVEMFNSNGVMLARAAVSHRIPRDNCFLYHAYERTMNVPLSRISGKRGGMINSLTRIFMKPTHMIGAYAQQSFGLNYYGPTGAERDAMVVVRKAGDIGYGEE